MPSWPWVDALGLCLLSPVLWPFNRAEGPSRSKATILVRPGWALCAAEGMDMGGGLAARVEMNCVG